jgi:N utilization substance protein A
VIKKNRYVLAQPQSEILLVAESVAREKGLEKEDVINILETALQQAAHEKYGQELDLHAIINPINGQIRIFRKCVVVEEVQDSHKEVSLQDALKKDANAKVGDVVVDDLPSLDFKRVSAYNVRKLIVEKVQEAERRQQIEEFKDRVGQMVSGIVKRVDNGNVYIDIGRSEGVLNKNEQINREKIRVGDRVKAYLVDLRPSYGPLLSLSRTHPGFLRCLFEQEIPEVYDGSIEVKSVARDPGSRAKVAVYTADSSLDPIGACVGPRGGRIQGIMTELRGEKIDIIMWAEDYPTFVANALAPTEVLKIVTDEDESQFDIVVPDAQLSAAIGRRGQNIRLVRILTGAHLTIASQSEAQERQAEDTASKVEIFVKNLGMDEITAQLFVTEGFDTLEDIALADIEELQDIQGLNIELVLGFKEKALLVVQEGENEKTKHLQDLGVQEELMRLFDSDLLLKLAEQGVKEIEDLKTLSPEELIQIVGEEHLSPDDARHILESL